jgi:hypothetical protein
MSAPFRTPDVVIGGHDRPYLRRWHLIPRNRWFNIYLHHFLRSDDDRALHDHPWWNASILLRGRYREHVRLSGGGTIQRVRRLGCVYLRRAEQAHRVELLPDGQGGEMPVWTLFLTGPKIREWGFLCPAGWRHWMDYVRQVPGGNEIGEGCRQ